MWLVTAPESSEYGAAVLAANTVMPRVGGRCCWERCRDPAEDAVPEFNVYEWPEPLGCGVTAGRAVSRVPICGGVDLQPSGDTVTVGAVAVKIVEEQVRFVIDCVGYVEAQAELVRVGREGGEVFFEVSFVLGRGAGGHRSGVGPRESRRLLWVLRRVAGFMCVLRGV